MPGALDSNGDPVMQGVRFYWISPLGWEEIAPATEIAHCDLTVYVVGDQSNSVSVIAKFPPSSGTDKWDTQTSIVTKETPYQGMRTDFKLRDTVDWDWEFLLPYFTGTTPITFVTHHPFYVNAANAVISHLDHHFKADFTAADVTSATFNGNNINIGDWDGDWYSMPISAFDTDSDVQELRITVAPSTPRKVRLMGDSIGVFSKPADNQKTTITIEVDETFVSGVNIRSTPFSGTASPDHNYFGSSQSASMGGTWHAVSTVEYNRIDRVGMYKVDASTGDWGLHSWITVTASWGSTHSFPDAYSIYSVSHPIFTSDDVLLVAIGGMPATLVSGSTSATSSVLVEYKYNQSNDAWEETGVIVNPLALSRSEGLASSSLYSHFTGFPHGDGDYIAYCNNRLVALSDQSIWVFERAHGSSSWQLDHFINYGSVQNWRSFSLDPTAGKFLAVTHESLLVFDLDESDWYSSYQTFSSPNSITHWGDSVAVDSNSGPNSSGMLLVSAPGDSTHYTGNSLDMYEYSGSWSYTTVIVYPTITSPIGLKSSMMVKDDMILTRSLDTIFLFEYNQTDETCKQRLSVVPDAAGWSDEFSYTLNDASLFFYENQVTLQKQILLGCKNHMGTASALEGAFMAISYGTPNEITVDYSPMAINIDSDLNIMPIHSHPAYTDSVVGSNPVYSLKSDSIQLSSNGGSSWMSPTSAGLSSSCAVMLGGAYLYYPSSCLKAGWLYRGVIEIVRGGMAVSSGVFSFTPTSSSSSSATAIATPCGNVTVAVDSVDGGDTVYRARAVTLDDACVGTVDIVWAFGYDHETSITPSATLDSSRYTFDNKCSMTATDSDNHSYTIKCLDIDISVDNWYFDIILTVPTTTPLSHSIYVAPQKLYSSASSLSAWESYLYKDPIAHMIDWRSAHISLQFALSETIPEMGGSPIWWELFPRGQSFESSALSVSELSNSDVGRSCGAFPWDSLDNEVRYTPSLSRPSIEWFNFYHKRPFTLSADGSTVITMRPLDPPTALLHRPTSGSWSPGSGREMTVVQENDYTSPSFDLFRTLVTTSYTRDFGTAGNALTLPVVSFGSDGSLDSSDMLMAGINGCSQLIETLWITTDTVTGAYDIDDMIMYIDICKAPSFTAFLAPNRSASDPSAKSTCTRVEVSTSSYNTSPTLDLSPLEPFSGREFVYIAAIKLKMLLTHDSGYCSRLYGSYVGKACQDREMYTNPGYIYLRDGYAPIEVDSFSGSWEELKKTPFFSSLRSVYSDDITYDDQPWIHPTDWVPFPPLYVMPNTDKEYTADRYFGLHLNSTSPIETDPSKPGYLDNYYAMPHPSASNAFRALDYSGGWTSLDVRLDWDEEFTWVFHDNHSDLNDQDNVYWMCSLHHLGSPASWKQVTTVPAFFGDPSTGEGDPYILSSLDQGTSTLSGVSFSNSQAGDVMMTTCTLSVVIDMPQGSPVDTYVIPTFTLSSPWTLTTSANAPTLSATSPNYNSGTDNCWPEIPSGRKLYETDYFPTDIFNLLSWAISDWSVLPAGCGELSDGTWPFTNAYAGDTLAQVVEYNSFRMVPFAVCSDNRVTYQVAPGVMTRACEGRYKKIGYAARDITGHPYLYSDSTIDRDINRVVWDPYDHIEDAFFRYYRHEEFEAYKTASTPPRQYFTDGVDFGTEPSFCAVSSKPHPNGLWPVELNYTLSGSPTQNNTMLLGVNDGQLEESNKVCWQIDITHFNKDNDIYISNGNIIEFNINVTKRASDYDIVPPVFVNQSIHVDQGTPVCGLQDPEGNDMCMYLWDGDETDLETAVSVDNPILKRTAVSTPNGLKLMVGPLRNEYSPIVNVTLKLVGTFVGANGDQAKVIKCQHRVEHWWSANYTGTEKPLCGLNETCYFPFHFGTDDADNCDAVQLASNRDYTVSVEAENAVGHTWTPGSLVFRYDEDDPECDPQSCGVCFGDTHDCVTDKTDSVIGTTNNTHVSISFSGWTDPGSYMLYYAARLYGPLVESGSDLVVNATNGKDNWLEKFPGYDYYNPGDSLDWTLIYNYSSDATTLPFSVVLPYTSTPPEGRYRLSAWGYNGLFQDNNDVSRQNRDSDIDLYIDLRDVGEWGFSLTPEDTIEWDTLRDSDGYLWTTKTNAIPIKVTNLTTAGGISDISHVVLKIVQETGTTVPAHAANHTIDLGWYTTLKDDDDLTYQLVQEDMWPGDGELAPGQYVIEACLHKYNGKVRCKREYVHIATGSEASPVGEASFPSVPLSALSFDAALPAIFSKKEDGLRITTDYSCGSPSGITGIEMWLATTGTPSTQADYVIQPFNITGNDYTITSSTISSLSEGWYFLSLTAYSQFALNNTVYKLWLDVDAPIAGPICSGLPAYSSDSEVECNANPNTGSHNPLYVGETVRLHWSTFADEVNVTYEACAGFTALGCEYAAWASTGTDRNASFVVPSVPIDSTVHVCVRATDQSSHNTTACATTIRIASPDFSEVSIRVSTTTGSAQQMPNNTTYISSGAQLYAEWDTPTLPASVQGTYTMEYQVCIEEATTHGETDHTFKAYNGTVGHHGSDKMQGTCTESLVQTANNDDSSSITLTLDAPMVSGKWYRLQLAAYIEVLQDYVSLFSHEIKVEATSPSGTYLLQLDSYSQHTVASCQTSGGLSSPAPFPEAQYYYGSEEESPEISLVFCGLVPDEHMRVASVIASLHTWASDQALPSVTPVSIGSNATQTVNILSIDQQTGTDLGMTMQLASTDQMTRTLLPSSLRHVIKVAVTTRSGIAVDHYTVPFSFEVTCATPSSTPGMLDDQNIPVRGVSTLSCDASPNVFTLLFSEYTLTTSGVVYQSRLITLDESSNLTQWMDLSIPVPLNSDLTADLTLPCSDIPTEKLMLLQMRAVNTTTSVAPSSSITVSGIVLFTNSTGVDTHNSVLSESLAGFTVCDRFTSNSCVVSSLTNVPFYWSYRLTSEIGLQATQIHLCSGSSVPDVCTTPVWSSDTVISTMVDANLTGLNDGIYTPFLCLTDSLDRDSCFKGANLHIDTVLQMSVSLSHTTGDDAFTVSWDVTEQGETVCDFLILMIGMQIGSGAVLTEKLPCTDDSVQVLFNSSVHNQHLYASMVSFDTLGRSVSDSLDLGTPRLVPPPTPSLLLSNTHTTNLGSLTDRLYITPSAVRVNLWGADILPQEAASRVSIMGCNITVEDEGVHYVITESFTTTPSLRTLDLTALIPAVDWSVPHAVTVNSSFTGPGGVSSSVLKVYSGVHDAPLASRLFVQPLSGLKAALIHLEAFWSSDLMCLPQWKAATSQSSFAYDNDRLSDLPLSLVDDYTTLPFSSPDNGVYRWQWIIDYTDYDVDTAFGVIVTIPIADGRTEVVRASQEYEGDISSLLPPSESPEPMLSLSQPFTFHPTMPSFSANYTVIRTASTIADVLIAEPGACSLTGCGCEVFMVATTTDLTEIDTLDHTSVFWHESLLTVQSINSDIGNVKETAGTTEITQSYPPDVPFILAITCEEKPLGQAGGVGPFVFQPSASTLGWPQADVVLDLAMSSFREPETGDMELEVTFSGAVTTKPWGTMSSDVGVSQNYTLVLCDNSCVSILEWNSTGIISFDAAVISNSSVVVSSSDQFSFILDFTVLVANQTAFRQSMFVLHETATMSYMHWTETDTNDPVVHQLDKVLPPRPSSLDLVTSVSLTSSHQGDPDMDLLLTAASERQLAILAVWEYTDVGVPDTQRIALECYDSVGQQQLQTRQQPNHRYARFQVPTVLEASVDVVCTAVLTSCGSGSCFAVEDTVVVSFGSEALNNVTCAVNGTDVSVSLPPRCASRRGDCYSGLLTLRLSNTGRGLAELGKRVVFLADDSSSEEFKLVESSIVYVSVMTEFNRRILQCQ